MSYQPGGEKTAEFSPIDAACAMFVHEKFARGWTMKGDTLVHPSDAELWLIPGSDPGKLTMSKKLAAQLHGDTSATWMLELMRTGRRRNQDR